MYRSTELPPAVLSYLSDFAERWKRVIALRAAGSALAVLILWIIAACAADRLLHLNSSIRLVLLAGAGLTSLAVGLFRLRRLRTPIDWVAVARVIERQDTRFNQSLITVTSRVLGPPEHRGSDEILSHLIRDVEHHVSDARKHQIIKFGSAAGPWALFLIAMAGIVGLVRVPGLGGGRLLARFIEPTADIPPVTTTELRVLRRVQEEVMQSDSFRIDAEAHRLGTSAMMLYINDDGANWARYTMDETADGQFTYTINGVGRDVHYYVRAGDAVSPLYSVLVKRPPAVAEFRVHYTYPAYTHKPPFDITNADGTIEAPTGSEAVITIVATEPLQSALLTIGSQKILMDKARDSSPLVRTAAIHVQDNLDYSLDLISTREVRGGPAKMLIRATADHPPLVRLLQAGQTLRLNPRDILPLSYQAMDDYGLDAVAIVAQVNADAPVRIPLRLHGDRRRQEDTVNFDLGSLKFKIGDVLSLTIAGRDTAGQETISEELRALVSPKAIDSDAHERIDELGWAAGFASTLTDEMDQAAKAAQDADGQDQQSSAWLSAEARVTRHLTSASESATLLRQALLRTIAHSSSPELSTALEGWIDVAHQETETADELFRRGGSVEGMGGSAKEQLRHAIDQARELHDQLFAVARGERAAAVLADREDLAAANHTHPSADAAATERLNQTLRRARGEIASNAQAVGVNASASDADAQLHTRVDAAHEILVSRHPVDLAAAAQQWAQRLQHDNQERIGLDVRLATAAQAEAVRSDADLTRARDLELAARAAAAIEAKVHEIQKGKPNPSIALLNPFAVAMAALQHEHKLSRDGPSNHSTDEMKLAREAASHARDEMVKWTGETNAGKNAFLAGRSNELESLALRAGAAAARRDYKRVEEHDAALAQMLSEAARKPGGRAIDNDASPAAAQLMEERLQHVQRTTEEVKHQMKDAESEDDLGQAQDKLAREAKSAQRGAGELAGRQRTVADQISEIVQKQSAAAFPTAAAGDLDDPNWRGRATAALLFAQEELAAMPQEIASVQEADRAHRKAVDRANAARHEIEGATLDRQPMLKRAAEQAEKDVRDSTRQLENAVAPVAPVAASDLANRLEPFAPEAATARDIVGGALVQALKALQDASRNGSADAIASAAGDALQAIDGAQKELVRAQDAFTARDPLIAAKWFARAAADVLAHHPGDLRTALAHQANVSLALSKAWDRSIHRASDLRLSEIPSLQTVYAAQSAPPRDTSTAAALSPNVVSRDWTRLHSHEADDLPATLSDPDPPGFEEPLRLYFETLGKAQEKSK